MLHVVKIQEIQYAVTPVHSVTSTNKQSPVLKDYLFCPVIENFI